MIAVDTNLLVMAHRREFLEHHAAEAAVRQLAESPRTWAIPLHCLVEFAGVVTHPRRFLSPTSPAGAQMQIDLWRESPSLQVLCDDPASLAMWQALVRAGAISGPMVHDARIAAVCLTSGVTELWTADRDYARFPALRSRNPLVQPTG